MEFVERCAVYRQFDADDQLLYVGMTGALDIRMSQHRLYSDWWPDAARMEVTWYRSRTEADAAEKLAIQTEGPLYNVVHKPGRVHWTALRPARPVDDGVVGMADLPRLLSARVAAAERGEQTVITKHHKPRAVLVSWETYLEILEMHRANSAPPSG